MRQVGLIIVAVGTAMQIIEIVLQERRSPLEQKNRRTF
jgi:hypothetical protein